MALISKTVLSLTLGLAIVISAAAQTPASASSELDDQKVLTDFAAIHPIDVHVHLFKADPAFQKMLEQLNLKVMNILVVDDTVPARKQLQTEIADARALVQSSRNHIAWCTTFDPYKFSNPTFSADAVQQIKDDFAHGAVAVKIWKNIGMQIKDANGKYVMADDPKFQPIYQEIDRQGKTLMSHQAEPDVAWGPPEPADPSWSYYQENPQWFVGNKPGFPAKQTILDARDHVLANNPKLRMVGVHLGSMERGFDQLSQHLDKYPNLAVDLAGRMEYLMLAPPDKVRAFLTKYQDRVLFGTDLDVLANANLPETLEEWRTTYIRDWKFLATDLTFTSEGKQYRGLNLPQPVLQKIFHDNAAHWIPGL